MTFTLTIETGNDAMETAADIGRALQTLGRQFISGAKVPDDGGKIMDANGNTVGKWEVSE